MVAGSSASQTIVEKMLPLGGLEPGDYTLRLRVTDNVRGETLTPEATFKVILGARGPQCLCGYMK